MDEFVGTLGKRMRRVYLTSHRVFLAFLVLAMVVFLFLASSAATNIYSVGLLANMSSANLQYAPKHDVGGETRPYGFGWNKDADSSEGKSYAGSFDANASFVVPATDTGGGQTAVNPSRSTADSSASLPGTFFSMDWNHFIPSATWPSVPFGGIRLWDNGVSWQEIETPTRYNWINLDKWLAAAAASHTDVLYVFGRTPTWASLRPSEPCGYGVGCAAPPSDVDSSDHIWKTFVTALVQHSLASPTAHIKFYEIWNEPDCVNRCTWTGTDAQLVTMARDAYDIIHNLDPNALVLGPSPHGMNLVSWLQAYYAAGGAASQDIVAFHPYVKSLDQLPAMVDNIRALTARYGIANQPLWSTEAGFGLVGVTPAQQAASLAQLYILLWSKNIARCYWYSWDGSPQWGQLWNTSAGINAAGIAYGTLENWLVGSVRPPSPCHQTSDATWHCTLTLSNGDPAEIVWKANAASTVATSPAFTMYRTLDNGAVNPIGANKVSVGAEPILLVATKKQ